MADKKNNIDKSKEHMEKSKDEIKKSKAELEKELKKTAEELRAKSERRYNDVVARLERERINVQNRVNEDYKEAQRYVSSNPEEGVAIAFAGGIVLGLCLGLMRK